MPDTRKPTSGPFRSIGRYIFIGLLTAAPLAITWWIVSFLFEQLSELGRPGVWALSEGIRPRFPRLADFMLDETVQSIAAVFVVLLFLYVLGWAAGRVIGQRLIAMFEAAIASAHETSRCCPPPARRRHDRSGCGSHHSTRYFARRRSSSDARDNTRGVPGAYIAWSRGAVLGSLVRRSGSFLIVLQWLFHCRPFMIRVYSMTVRL